MDADFIQQNQIIERYLAGKLPLKGAQDFERYCREHPEALTSLGMSDRINAALRLLDAAGEPEPWAEKPLAFYQKPAVFFPVAAAALLLLGATGWLASESGKKDATIAALTKAVAEQPLRPAQSTRPIVVQPSRTGPVSRSQVSVGGGDAVMADFKIDVSWSTFNSFRVTMDREDQGRAMVLGSLNRDSNGHLRIALNSTAVGPGDYDLTLEGLDWRGNPKPQGWVRFSVAH